MRRKRLEIAVCAIALLLAAGPLAAAVPPAAPTQTITIGEQGRLSGQEARDHAVYQRAMRDYDRQGFPGLQRHLADLTKALGHAPETYPAIEQVRNRVVVRATDPDDGMILSIMAGALSTTDGNDRRVVSQPNVYPAIALMLGTEAVERHQYEEAISLLDRGLLLQPNDRFLIGERIAALHGLGRWEEALRAADAALAAGDLLTLTDTGGLHRKRGFSLIELGRLDEAEAAYEAALAEDPGDASAKRELDYIRGLRAGRPAAPVEIVVPANLPPAT